MKIKVIYVLCSIHELYKYENQAKKDFPNTLYVFKDPHSEIEYTYLNGIFIQLDDIENIIKGNYIW